MASEPIYKVFVSSTFEDLREERAEVQKALLKLNCLPVGMELFPAADDETWDFIKEQINDSDYYVVLVGGRYGSLAQDGMSFTEKEYDYARERGVPSIGFVHGDRGAIPSGKVESDPELLKKLHAFISKIRTRPIRTYLSPHQLAVEVTTSFIDLKRTKPRTGFVRTDQAVDYKKYAELLEKVANLEKKLMETQAEHPFIGHDETVKIINRTIKWSEIFLAIASTLITPRVEEYVSRELFEYLAMHHPEIKGLEYYHLSVQDFDGIRERFFATNLIDIDIEKFQGLGTRYWKLTEYGRRQFALFRYRLSEASS